MLEVSNAMLDKVPLNVGKLLDDVTTIACPLVYNGASDEYCVSYNEPFL